MWPVYDFKPRHEFGQFNGEKNFKGWSEYK